MDGAAHLGSLKSVIVADSAASVATVRGTASVILLALWNRVPIDRLGITGDAAVVDAN